jgi:hypothetical protein
MKQFIKGMSGWAFLVLALSASAFAKGGEVGNGGDVFQCQNSKSVLVDIYEAQAERGIKLDLGPPRLALFSKVDMAIKRLTRLSPIRAKMYSDQAHNFFSEASLIPDAQLTPIQDVYNWATPDGCVLKQIAVQIVPQFPQDKRYLVSKDLWDQLDDDSKAALILHEVIYREAISLGFTNSISVRYFNSLIFSHELDQATPKTFVDTLRSLPFEDYENNGTQFKIKDGVPITFFNDGQIESVQPPAWNASLNNEIDCRPGTLGCSVHFDEGGNVTSAFSSSMKFRGLSISGDFTYGKNWSVSKVEDASIAGSGCDIRVGDLDASNFDQNGALAQADWVGESLYNSNSPGAIYSQNGVLSRLSSGPPVKIHFQQTGLIETIHSDAPVEFLLRPGTNALGPFNLLWVTDFTGTNDGYLQLASNLTQDFFLTFGTTDPSTGQMTGIDFMAGTALSFQTSPSVMLVAKGTLGKDAVLPVDLNGKTQKFPAGTIVQFDPNGIVIPTASR